MSANELSSLLADWRHVCHTNLGKEVFFVGKITRRPEKTRRDGFRPRFCAELYAPLISIVVAQVELGVRAA